MRQERKDILINAEKFEDGVLRADACMERHCISRHLEFRTSKEDRPFYAFGQTAEWEERRLIAKVYQLIALGISPKGDCSLEEFVEKNQDQLEGGE